MSVTNLYQRIEALSEQASIDSGTSYDEYIRLFTRYFERNIIRKSKESLRIAAEFGYSPGERVVRKHR